LAIAVTVIVNNQPYGNPGSLGEPLGIFAGDAVATGDATGGTVQINFNPQNPTDTPTLDDHRLQYVWFIDQVSTSVDAAAGSLGLLVFGHYARPNQALATPMTIRSNVAQGAAPAGVRAPERGWRIPGIDRFPIFWDTQELAAGNNVIVNMIYATNVDLASYRFQVMGRYYDKQVLTNRAFGRLIGPPGISQFEG